MSANEVIEQIQKLPSDEQERVFAFLLEKRSRHKVSEGEVQYATDAEFDKSADKILREHAELFRRLAQ